MECLHCLPTGHVYSTKNLVLQVAAISVMTMIDQPICHRLADVVSFITSKVIASGITAAEIYTSYRHPHIPISYEHNLITSLSHNYIHKAVGAIIPESEHDHEHGFVQSSSEMSMEITGGYLLSLLLPRSVVLQAHNLDIMHLIPGWEALEQAAPFIADGHGVAESALYAISIVGPAYDIFVRGLDPDQITDVYFFNSPLSIGYYAINNEWADI